MTLQLLHSEFPYIGGKFGFLFISVGRPQVEDNALCMYHLMEAGGWWEILRS